MADWSPFDIVGSPVYNVLETASGLPFVDQTGLAGWLESAPMWQGVRNFQGDRPGWSGEYWADLGAAFIPWGGWGLATARAGGGALGAVNSAALGAARLFPRSPTLAFAAGETARYLPMSAAVTGFDYAGGRYDNPVDALTNFGLGTIGGGVFQAGGHALAPLVGTVPLIGPTWRAVFEPGPELGALYGFTDNARRVASTVSGAPEVQRTFSPTVLEPQLRASNIRSLIQDVEEAQALVTGGGTFTGDPRLLEPRLLPLLRSQYHQEERNVLLQQADPVDQPFRLEGEDVDRDVANVSDALTRFGVTGDVHRGWERIRVPMLGSAPDSIDNPDYLSRLMELPEQWIQDVQYPGVTQVPLVPGTYLRRRTGLLPGYVGSDYFRQVVRTGPSGRMHTWTIAEDPDTGMFQVVTPIPGEHKMTFRGRFDETRNKDINEPAQAFFSFLTHRPDRFFPELLRDLDLPDPEVAFSMRDRIQRGQSEFLDQLMGFRELYLSKANLRAAHAGRGTPRALTKSLLEGPTFGKEISTAWDTYVNPAKDQLRRSPEARGVVGVYRAAYDFMEARVLRRLYGKASIPERLGPAAALFSQPNMADENALATMLRRAVMEDPDTLEIIRKFDKVGGIELESIAGTPAGKWLKAALDANAEDLLDGNRGLDVLRRAGATDARLIPERSGHIGLSRSWDGSIHVPIYRPDAVQPVAVRAGHSREHAISKAQEWIKHVEATEGTKGHYLGESWNSNSSDPLPDWARPVVLEPSLLEPRKGMRGFEHEFEPYKHVDEFIAELERNAMARARYFASATADALTTGQKNLLRGRDPKAFEIVKTRIEQLQAQEGDLEKRLNNMIDPFLAPVTGTKSVTKVASAINALNTHLLHMLGYIGTPFLNLTSVLQTHLPAAVEFLTSSPSTLKGMGFEIPAFDQNGMPTRGFNIIMDPAGLLAGGFENTFSPGEANRAVYQDLWNSKHLAASLANEYNEMAQTFGSRFSEGIRGGDDVLYWANKLSTFLMTKSEQFSRVVSVGMALKAMDLYEGIREVRFSHDQKVRNAINMVLQTNYGYFKHDRPLMFTSPFGSVFGNQKTWMVNYLMTLARHSQALGKGNFAPLLFSLGTTAALGGVFAVPVLGQGVDAVAKWMEGSSGEEWIYENLGEGGNAIAFGLPALFGMSLQGNVAAPGSNLAHDSEFFFSVVALQRAQALGRAIGRGWNDQVVLGMNPLRDEVFRRQAAAALAPRSLYRGFEALTSDELTSAASGYPSVRGLGWGARLLHGVGFRDIDVAVQYAAYENMVKDRDRVRGEVGVFGDAYARAMISDDREEMMRLLQVAAVRGISQTSMMQSARTRLRNMGLDMFGRNFTQEQRQREGATLAAGGWNG